MTSYFWVLNLGACLVRNVSPSILKSHAGHLGELIGMSMYLVLISEQEEVDYPLSRLLSATSFIRGRIGKVCTEPG